jgi:soluble lytic murein transglycosylase-like protein
VIPYYLPPQCEALVIYIGEIEAAAGYWGGYYEVDLDSALAVAVACWESGGDPNVVSSAGAIGIFQVMPFHFTALENPYDPSTNIRVGVGVLAHCLMINNGDERGALMCYYGGAGYGAMGPEYIAGCDYYAGRVLGLRDAIAPVGVAFVSPRRMK